MALLENKQNKTKKPTQGYLRILTLCCHLHLNKLETCSIFHPPHVPSAWDWSPWGADQGAWKETGQCRAPLAKACTIHQRLSTCSWLFHSGFMECLCSFLAACSWGAAGTPRHARCNCSQVLTSHCRTTLFLQLELQKTVST